MKELVFFSGTTTSCHKDLDLASMSICFESKQNKDTFQSYLFYSFNTAAFNILVNEFYVFMYGFV